MTPAATRRASRRRDAIGPRPLTRNPTASVLALAAALGAGATGCIDSGLPLAPQCTATIEIEIDTEAIHAGDTFAATASSRGDECLSNLMWSAFGVISFDAAEARSATFHADDSGTGTIRVINDKGTLGVLEVTVEEGEEGMAPR